jgi:hypothetical protein
MEIKIVAVEITGLLLFSPALDHYFDLAEYLALRASLLAFLLLGLYRLIKMEWKRK